MGARGGGEPVANHAVEGATTEGAPATFYAGKYSRDAQLLIGLIVKYIPI